MKNASTIRRTVRLSAGVTALWLAAVTSAAAQAPVVSVAVFADHYVLGGRYIDDLDALEDAIAAIRPRGVRIEACGAGTARALRAAAHRFRNLYQELRVASDSDLACLPASVAGVVSVSQRVGQRPFGIYDEAVDRWWNNLIP